MHITRAFIIITIVYVDKINISYRYLLTDILLLIKSRVSTWLLFTYLNNI